MRDVILCAAGYAIPPREVIASKLLRVCTMHVRAMGCTPQALQHFEPFACHNLPKSYPVDVRIHACPLRHEPGARTPDQTPILAKLGGLGFLVFGLPPAFVILY